MKKYGDFLAAALGALPLTARAVSGHMGPGRPGMGSHVFNSPALGDRVRGPGRSDGFVFRSEGRFHRHEFDRDDGDFDRHHRFSRSEVGFVGFGFPYPYDPYADVGYPYAEAYSGDGYGSAAAVDPNDPAAAVQTDVVRRGDGQSPAERVISPARSEPRGSPSGPCYARRTDGALIAGEPQTNFRPKPDQPAAPRADPARANASTLVAPATAAAHGHVLDKLVLVSCLEQSGKGLILVENTETHEVQQITSQPNKDHFRIVEMHLNANPKLTEVMISNGSEQGPVKFRFDMPITGNPPADPAPSVKGVPGQTGTE